MTGPNLSAIELGHGLLNLGELRALTGDAEGARRAFAQCLTVRERVLAAGERTWDRLLEMAWAEARLAQFGEAPYSRWKRVRDLLREADAQQPLKDLEEGLLTVAHIVLSAGRGG